MSIAPRDITLILTHLHLVQPRASALRVGKTPYREATMHFKADKDWEMNSPYINKTLGTNKRYYGLIELSYNFNVLILDADIEEDDGIIMGVRFLFGHIDHALSFMDQDVFVSTRLALLARHSEDKGDYYASEIIKIDMGYDSHTQPSYVYHLRNGEEHLETLLAQSKNELTNIKTIYFKGEEDQKS